MPGVVSPPALAPPAPGFQTEARLALAEFFLGSLDLDACARRGLDWLAAHARVREAWCGVVDEGGRQLVTLAAVGARTPTEYTVGLDHATHPLIRALTRGEPAFFSHGLRAVHAPVTSAPVHALPLRAPRSGHAAADGLLVITGVGPALNRELLWFAEIFGQQITRLRSQQVRAESWFGQERVLLYSIINSVTDPILLTDLDGKLIIANSRAEKLFAAPEESSEGWRRAVSLNTMLFSAALSTGAMEGLAPTRRELLLVDPNDGSDLLFELLSAGAKDVRQGTYVVSVLRNITDLGRASEQIEDSSRRLRAAEAAIRAERHRLELIIDSVADPIVVTDANGDITLMNARGEGLFTVPANASEPVQRFVQANGAHFTSFVSNALFSGEHQPYSGSIHLVVPETGLPMPVEAISGQVLSDQGELTAVVTILHDRTQEMERARLYEQLKRASQELEGRVQEATAELAEQNELLRRQAIELEQASALKSQFLANMSHEFRTPLNAILGYTQMLQQGVSGALNPPQKRNLDRIDSNGRHLLALVNDILDITRIEAGRMPLHASDIQVQELIHEVKMELEPIIARSRLTVATDIRRKLPTLRTDRQKVKQILLNLLSNALKFTPRGSVTMTVRYDQREKTFAIAVADTGMGIPAEHQERIFEDFRQLDDSPTRTHFGTGLGLSICRRLSAMLGGRITVQSRPGAGSTFTLWLPRRVKAR